MGKFTAIQTSIKGLTIIQPAVFGDVRGFFMESFTERDFFELGITEHFVQDNHSKSSRGVLRGMHFQSHHSQGKLIRVVAGAVLDAVIDLRPESATFGRWEAVMLSAENKLQLYVPPRFAHGFLTLEENTEFLYKCTEYYTPEFDGGVLWSDPEIGIDWQLERYGLTEEKLLMSEKDKKQPVVKSINWNSLWE